jgi:hypothetical protein
MAKEWRRGRDSNPRYGFTPYNGLANPVIPGLEALAQSTNAGVSSIGAARSERRVRGLAESARAQQPAQQIFDPRSGKPHKTLDQVLSRFRILPNGCHEWTGTRNQYGYGLVCLTIEGKITTMGAHRLQWVRYNGPLPEGMDALHDCPGGDNRACINLDHLWSGTPADNQRDMREKGRQNWRPMFEACPNWTEETRAANIERFCVPAQESAQIPTLPQERKDEP